jgi:hypothetical protein
MHLCLFQGYPAFHYEMIGVAIHFCLQHGFTFDIYAHPNELAAEWKRYYDQLFSLSSSWFNPWELEGTKYDFILLLTDDDYAFKNVWLMEYGEKKVICINHHVSYRRYYVLEHVKLRYYDKLESQLYFNNCYPVLSYEQKLPILQQQRDQGVVDILCLGHSSVPLEINTLKRMFPHFENIRFHIASREIHPEFRFHDSPTLFYYENCPVEKIIELLTRSSYILCFDHSIYPGDVDSEYKHKKSSEWYRDEISSASIHLSFCFGCQLILPSGWKTAHRRKSCITYNENCPVVPIDRPPSSEDLLAVYRERDELIEQRNRVLLSIMERASSS